MYTYFLSFSSDAWTPVKIVCDNLKIGVIMHPKHGEIVLNDAYLSFAEHYQVAIMPAEVRKPKQKPSVEYLFYPFTIHMAPSL